MLNRLGGDAELGRALPALGYELPQLLVQVDRMRAVKPADIARDVDNLLVSHDGATSSRAPAPGCTSRYSAGAWRGAPASPIAA
jgi:hypothetical protein